MTVAMDHVPHRLTWEAFIELPEELLRHAELHDGEVVQMASPDRPHQLTLVNLIMALGPWVREHGGEIVPDPHVRIADYWGYQPDLAYYAPDRVPGSGYWKLAPNLAVEILSPSTRRKDLLRKPTHYFSVGVEELWLVDCGERLFHVLHANGEYHEWVDGDVAFVATAAGLRGGCYRPDLPGFMTPHDHPLFEFDPSQQAVINPSIHKPIPGFPSRAVTCWFGNVVRDRTTDLQPVHNVPFEHGDHAIFVIQHRGFEVALVSPGVGAPAAVTSLEVLISLGATHIIGCGGAGIVRPGFDVGHVIVPTGAIRDEGTSYHYAPADAEVVPHPLALTAIDDVLTEAGIPHDHGLTWTTDAFFRETPAKVARRREQGCITVEMEAASMFAAAAFRGVVYGQLLYAGDDVSAAEWDERSWDAQHSARDRLLDLALDAVIRL